MGEIRTLDKSNHSLSGLNLSLLFRFSRPVQGVHLLLRVVERPEGPLVLDPRIPFFLNEDPMEKRLVTQPPVRVISALVHTQDVGEQPERIIEVRPC